MGGDPITCWSMIEGAARGRPDQRDAFARRYEPAVSAYLRARWSGGPLLADLDDAVQEVFVECFRSALARASDAHPGGFRAFLYGITRNVARRFEERRARRREHPATSVVEREAERGREETLSMIFDRTWARALLKQARREQTAAAAEAGPEALRRVDLLRLRFVDGMPVREIATTWGLEAAYVHREYAKARREFKAALVEVVRRHLPDGSGNVEQECTHLLALLK